MAEGQEPAAGAEGGQVTDDQLREDILRGITLEGEGGGEEVPPEPGAGGGAGAAAGGEGGGAGEDAEPTPNQPVPWESFKKRTDRFAKQKGEWSAAEQNYKAQLDAYKRGGALSPEDAGKYRQLTALMGNLDKSVNGKPEVAQALLDMLQGREPNWRTLHEALGKRLQGLPNDPIVASGLERLKQDLERLEQARTDDVVAARVNAELPEVRRLLGDDPAAVQLVLNIGAGMVNAIPPGQATLENLPSLVEIAKQLDAYGVGREQRRLESLRSRGAEARAGGPPVGVGAAPGERGGGRARKQDDAPPGTRAYYKQLQGLAYTAEDLETPA